MFCFVGPFKNELKISLKFQSKIILKKHVRKPPTAMSHETKLYNMKLSPKWQTGHLMQSDFVLFTNPPQTNTALGRTALSVK